MSVWPDLRLAGGLDDPGSIHVCCNFCGPAAAAAADRQQLRQQMSGRMQLDTHFSLMGHAVAED